MPGLRLGQFGRVKRQNWHIHEMHDCSSFATNLHSGMPQEPLPPQYTSSESVLNGISLAYSTNNNPRGLECMWNGPYGQTFHELLSTYRGGQFILYSPWTLWVPALVKKEKVLRKDFQDNGLDYDAPDPYHAALDRATHFQRFQVASDQVAVPSGSRTSKRIKEANISKGKADLAALEAKVADLFKRRKAMIMKQDELTMRKYELFLMHYFIRLVI